VRSILRLDRASDVCGFDSVDICKTLNGDLRGISLALSYSNGTNTKNGIFGRLSGSATDTNLAVQLKDLPWQDEPGLSTLSVCLAYQDKLLVSSQSEAARLS
jgi:hypothetical protein